MIKLRLAGYWSCWNVATLSNFKASRLCCTRAFLWARIAARILFIGLVILIEFSRPSVGQLSQLWAEHDETLCPSWPHPFAIGDLSLNGGGFSPVSAEAEGGVDVETKRLIFDSVASYNGARKSNDGTINNRKGRTRDFESGGFYRFLSWHFGAGIHWGELSTTNYTKEAWGPSLGAGRDILLSSSSFRAQVIYNFAGNDYQNGVQGPSFRLWIPSPATAHHVFLKEQLNIYESHSTVTDRGNKQLSADEVGARSVSSDFRMGLLIRF